MLNKKPVIFTFKAITAGLVCFVVASLSHSQMVLYQLTKIDVAISLNTWLSASMHDLIGLLPTYGLIIMLSLLIAFSIANLVSRWLNCSKLVLFIIAGASTIALINIALNSIMHITLIAGARSGLGFLLQCLAGAIGGWCFYQLTKQPIISQNT